MAGGTALFGLIFLGFQAYEFTHFVHEGLTLQQNLFGSTFFMLTGFHGGHVALGVVWLLTLLILDCRGGSASADAPKVEIVGLYWHFVDVVWIAIFTLVYLIPDERPASRAAPPRARTGTARDGHRHASVATYVKMAVILTASRPSSSR